MPKQYRLSEMMRHYLNLKEKYNDAFLFYRLGDFYELFFDDAEKVSKILDITLTGRECGLKERAPMCGVPHHAAEGYISRLVKEGYKVAICEQLTQPGDQKGLVKRDVVRIVTPGTITSEDSLESSDNNYLASVYIGEHTMGLAWSDVSTGHVGCKNYDTLDIDSFIEGVISIKPSEIVANKNAFLVLSEFENKKNGVIVKPQEYIEHSYDRDIAIQSILSFYKINNIAALGLEKSDGAISALGAMFKYLSTTQKVELLHFSSPQIDRDSLYMHLDQTTIKNLELLEGLFDGKVKGSLLGIIDKTSTSMGSREIKKIICKPLANEVEINNRLNATEELVTNNVMRESIHLALTQIRDLERICSKISYNSINPRECLNIADSLQQIQPIKAVLKGAKSSFLKNLNVNLNEAKELIATIHEVISDNPPLSLKDGGVIKEGYSQELDDYRNAQKNAKLWLANYEQKERENTQLKTLRIGYNRVFGYYLEVSNSYLDKVPENYIRKQTLSTGERFFTVELKEMEEKILGSVEKSIALEESIYQNLKKTLLNFLTIIQNNARQIALLDVIISFALVSKANFYVKPKVLSKNSIILQAGRHPVVESIRNKGEFISNDTNLDKDTLTLVITGPNMAGKSTYMRQVALIVLLMHIGCFVPCDKAEIGVFDRIFTRVGASDNVAFGQSTFMVEMTEVANILHNATENSLVILDEIGRGTSTIDGLAIAWAIAEYITLKIKPKTLFATHYHELSELEKILPKVKNYHVLIREINNKIVFLYKIVRGWANKSFGVEVASLAGVKENVIDRAFVILSSLEQTHDLEYIRKRITSNATSSSIPTSQIGFFESEDNKFDEVINSIIDINIDNCTPIEALTILANLKKKVKKLK